MSRHLGKISRNKINTMPDPEFDQNKGKLSAAWAIPVVIQPKVIECWRVDPADNEAGFEAVRTFMNEKG